MSSFLIKNFGKYAPIGQWEIDGIVNGIYNDEDRELMGLEVGRYGRLQLGQFQKLSGLPSEFLTNFEDTPLGEGALPRYIHLPLKRRTWTQSEKRTKSNPKLESCDKALCALFNLHRKVFAHFFDVELCINGHHSTGDYIPFPGGIDEQQIDRIDHAAWVQVWHICYDSDSKNDSKSKTTVVEFFRKHNIIWGNPTLSSPERHTMGTIANSDDGAGLRPPPPPPPPPPGNKRQSMDSLSSDGNRGGLPPPPAKVPPPPAKAKDNRQSLEPIPLSDSGSAAGSFLFSLLSVMDLSESSSTAGAGSESQRAAKSKAKSKSESSVRSRRKNDSGSGSNDADMEMEGQQDDVESLLTQQSQDCHSTWSDSSIQDSHRTRLDFNGTMQQATRTKSRQQQGGDEDPSALQQRELDIGSNLEMVDENYLADCDLQDHSLVTNLGPIQGSSPSPPADPHQPAQLGISRGEIELCEWVNQAVAARKVSQSGHKRERAREGRGSCSPE